MLAFDHENKGLRVEDWGLVDYEVALNRQLSLLELRRKNLIRDTLVFCSHGPVATLGRAGSRDRDLLGWSGPVFEVQRGGRATYHGPSQVIGYPVVQLKSRDLHKYLRFLEDVIVDALNAVGVDARIGDQGFTGVWVKEKKICSIGIAVKSWVSYHGFALNLLEDPQAFKGLMACGWDSTIMTSVEEVIGGKMSHADLHHQILNSWTRISSENLP